MHVGVAYYPEHWPEERWPVDARMMREAGISLVRLAEFAWSKLEPTEGRYEFAWLDRVLTILHAEGIKAVLGTPTAAPPAWLHEKYPDIYPADERRYRLGFGTRLQRCLNNDVMRWYARRITEAMAEHFGQHPAVIGWQIDNEFEANLCYCEVCAAKFRDWLRKRYGTLEALNAAWGTVFWSQTYTNWSQIPLPWQARCGRAHNPSLLLDYQRFASESTVSFQREQVEIIRRASPGRFITHNLMGLHDSLDYFALAQDLEFVSWDNYPGFSDAQTNWSALAHDVVRGIKQKGFWVMEEQAGITGWSTIGRRPEPGQIRSWAWQAIGHGAETVIFFRWRSCLYGTEQFWHGILNHDGRPSRRYWEIVQFAKEIRDLAPLLEGSTIENQVAILNSYEQNWALQIQLQTKGLEWWEQTRRYHNALTRLGVNADIVPLSASLRRYRVVIAPSWYILTQNDAERLAEFAREGGILILSPRTGVKDIHNACWPEALPSYLCDVTGLEVDDYDPLGEATSSIRLTDGREYTVSVWADALRLTEAEPLAFYTSPPFPGEPAAARHRYGTGTVYYLGTYGEPAFYHAVLGHVLTEAGITYLTGLPEGVDVTWRIKQGGRYLFVINLTGGERTLYIPKDAVTLLGPEPKDGVLFLTGYAVGIYKVL
ncbi:MAG: beta-galactosidase [Bacillota bacterium]